MEARFKGSKCKVIEKLFPVTSVYSFCKHTSCFKGTVSAPPPYDLDTSNFDRYAQLAYIGKNGNSININEQLNSLEAALLFANDQSLIIKAHNDRLGPGRSVKTNGFYRINRQSPHAPTQIADAIPGPAYVGRNQEIFVLGPDINSITNVTTKKTYRWWD